MNLDYWQNSVPMDIKNDTLWTLEVYRISLFISELCWSDIKIIRAKKLFSLSDQLYRSIGSISANIAEGYSRNSFKEQARFYEIALGSTRESKDWYFKSRHLIGNKKMLHRIQLLTSISKLLIVMINERRKNN